MCVMLFILLVFHSATSLALQVTNQIHADVKKKGCTSVKPQVIIHSLNTFTPSVVGFTAHWTNSIHSEFKIVCIATVNSKLSVLLH